ncbi:MAG: DNA-directed RNA polymerase subunit omega [Vicinamibacterales bacterium]
MEDAPELPSEPLATEGSESIESADAPVLPGEPAPPISSRFLFVDVAALRAKQLRRGARLRFDVEPGTPAPIKPERKAMEEVRRGLVYYNVPEWRRQPDEAPRV